MSIDAADLIVRGAMHGGDGSGPMSRVCSSTYPAHGHAVPTPKAGKVEIECVDHGFRTTCKYVQKAEKLSKSRSGGEVPQASENNAGASHSKGKLMIPC